MSELHEITRPFLDHAVHPIGNPYHGLVQGGEVELPNGEIKTVPQPAGGDTLLVRVPGVPPVALTDEQQEKATARGWQWWDRAIISGGRRQLYGLDLAGFGEDNFIYCSSTGNRWLVDVSQIVGENVPLDESLNADVEVVRFGEFGLEDDQASTVSVSLADLGQQMEPKLPWANEYDAVLGETPTHEDTVEADVVLKDVAPDGSSAIFAIERWTYFVRFTDRSDEPFEPLVRAIGFLRLDVIEETDDDIQFELVVHHDRAATMGTETSTDTEHIETTRIGLALTSQVIEEQVDQDCNGYQVVEYTQVESTTNAINVDYDFRSGERHTTRTGRVIAVWWNEEGELEDVLMDQDKRQAISRPHVDANPSGSARVRFEMEKNAVGECIRDEDNWTLESNSLAFEFTRSSSASLHHRTRIYVLDAQGQTKWEATRDLELSGNFPDQSFTGDWQQVSAPGELPEFQTANEKAHFTGASGSASVPTLGPISFSYADVSSAPVTPSGGVLTDNSEGIDPINRRFGFSITGWVGEADLTGVSNFHPPRLLISDYAQVFVGDNDADDVQRTSDATFVRATLTLTRFANKLIGNTLHLQDANDDASAGEYSLHRHLACFAPGAEDQAHLEFPEYYDFGSYDPVNQEIARGDQPLCWI